MTDNNILQISNLEKLITELKEIDFVRIRQYLNENKNIQNVCYIDKLTKVLLRQSTPEFKKAYCKLTSEYSHQIGVRGDGNCFYRSIILLYLFQLASSEDSNELLNFILKIRDLRNIRLEYTSVILKAQDLQKVFVVFLMKIYSWKVQSHQFNIYTILNEYNSLPEVDLAAITVCRYLIYTTFIQTQNHSSFASFIDDEMKQRIPKILLKQNEYAEDIIIPIAAQTFFCELVVQNLYQDQEKINIEKLVYKPQITFKGNNQMQFKQLNILFTKDHYDCLIQQQITSQNPNFYNISSITFTQNFQNTSAYINFLYHQKFKLQQNQKSQNQISQSQFSSSSFDEFGLAFEPKKVNSQNSPSGNQQDENNQFLQFQNFSSNNNKQLNNLKQPFLSSRNSLSQQQQQQMSPSNIQQNIKQNESIQNQQQKPQSIQFFNQLNQNSQNLQNQSSLDSQRNNLKQNFFSQQNSNNNAQLQSNQNQLLKSQSLVLNQQITNNNINQSTKQINDIPLINSAFMMDQIPKLDSNIKPSSLQQTNKNPIKVSLSNNQTQNFKKSLVEPILKFEEDDDSDDGVDSLIINDDEEEEEEVNPIRQDNKQKSIIIAGRNVCIQCKLPFKSTKFILKGNQITLLCLDCLEQIMEHVSKDEKTVKIDDFTYQFGDSILQKIKEKFIKDKDLKKDNITPQIYQKSQSAKFETLSSVQKPKLLLQSKSEIKTSSTQNNSVNKQDMASSIRHQICGQCSKTCTSSYEITQIKNQKDEEKQRICPDCVPIFVLYYQNPSEIIKFGGNTYKIDKVFGKYLYYQQLLQNMQADEQVVDDSKKQNKSASQQNNKIKNCLVCKKDTLNLFYMNSATDKKIQQAICSTCFYYNMNCVKDKEFTFENKKFYMDQVMQDYAKDIISAQVYEYQLNNGNNYLD